MRFKDLKWEPVENHTELDEVCHLEMPNGITVHIVKGEYARTDRARPYEAIVDAPNERFSYYVYLDEHKLEELLNMLYNRIFYDLETIENQLEPFKHIMQSRTLIQEEFKVYKRLLNIYHHLKQLEDEQNRIHQVQGT